MCIRDRHTVVKAASGQDALALLSDHQGLDLVITDQAMPDMTGVQLAAELQSLRPGLPVIIATGFAELSGEAAAGLPLLSKPFSQGALALAINSAVAK